MLRDLEIVDCSRNNEDFPIYFEEPDPSQRTQAVWAHIDRAFAKPVTKDDLTADYAPTQIIAETFKHYDFDGIAYKSAFGKEGYNIVLFDIEAAELINCFLIEAKSIDIEFSETANPYFVQKHY